MARLTFFSPERRMDVILQNFQILIGRGVSISPLFGKKFWLKP
jgi:hypothetical protein